MDIYSMIEQGKNVKFEVSGEDLCHFADRIIAKTIEMRDAEMAAHPEDEELVSVEKAQELLHVCATTLWSWNTKGYLVPIKVGRKRYYKMTDIRALLNNSNEGLAARTP